MGKDLNRYQKELLLDWMRKVHRLEWSHRYEAKKWHSLNTFFGVISIVLATLIAGASTIPGIAEWLLKLIVSIGAIVVAIFSGLQTFLRPTELAERLGRRSDEYESIRHDLEELYEFDRSIDQQFYLKLDKIRGEWKKISALHTSDKNFKKAGKVISRDNRYPKSLNLQRKESEDELFSIEEK